MKTKRQNRKFLIINGLIAVIGLIIRLIAGFQLLRYDSRVADPAKVTDMWTYLNFAREILSGEVPREFYYQPFYYSVFLPIVQFFWRDSMAPIIIVQSLCGAGAIYLAGLLAGRIAGKKAGLIAAGLLALSQICIIYTPYALLETMQSFWLILLLYMTFRSWSGNHLWQWLLTGVVLSFAILSRGNAWIFLPAIILAAWFASRKKEMRKRSFALVCGVILLGTILPQLPYSIVNTVESGYLRGPSTAGGNVLALGNTPEAPPGGLTYPETYQLWMEKEQEVPISKRIIDWALEEPLPFLELQFRKVFLFWDQREIPNNISPAEALEKAPLLNALRFIPTGVILIGALLCIFLSLRKIFKGKERLLTAILFVLLYCFGMAAFYNLARFRVPCVPLLCVLAGCGIFFFLKCFRKDEKKKLRILLGVFALLLAYFIVYPGYDFYRAYCEPGIMRAIRPDGVNVPNRLGGRLIYDHGPRILGDWQPVRARCLFKEYQLQEPITAGSRIKLSIAVVCGGGRPIIGVNGLYVDLSAVPKGTVQMIHLEVPYPGDNVFRVEFTENLFPVVDLQRAYGRTYDYRGAPIDAELAMSISTFGKEKQK